MESDGSLNVLAQDSISLEHAIGTCGQRIASVWQTSRFTSRALIFTGQVTVSGVDMHVRIISDFAAAVNMTADELEDWLSTPESHKVGWKKGDPANESVGHASGRRVVRLLRGGNASLAADDYAHMRKVAAFVKRHRGQQPANVVSSRWRYSLMNWGHDPLKDMDH